MGLFEHWPYTNFHDLNLDWIIKKLPEVFTASAQAVQSAETAVEAKNDAVAAKEDAQSSAENAASSEENAERSAESAQDYAEHIADPVGGLVTTWLDDNITPTTPPVDASLTVQGAAADAKATGDALNDLTVRIEQGIPYDIKQAIDSVLQNVAFKNNYGYSSVLSLIHAWATNIELLSISASYDQSTTVYEGSSLDVLKPDLTVTAHFDNGTTATVSNYALSGELTVGTSVITVSYLGKTTTFNVTVAPATREMLFGVFQNGYALGKSFSTTVTNLQQYLPFACRNATAARATTQYPCRNKGYVFTVTDSSRYNIAVYDPIDNNAISAPGYSGAVDETIYRCGSKQIAWASSDSAATDYVWIALKKMDGTAFTAEELADGAAAVFTYTSQE